MGKLWVGAALFLGTALVSSQISAAPDPAQKKPDQTFVYPWRSIDNSGLPSVVLARRKADEGLTAICGSQSAAVDKSALLIGLIVQAVNLVIGAVDKALTAKEDRYIESLSLTTAASATSAAFPISAQDPPSCLVVDRISAGNNDKATYVLMFVPVGKTAFTVELAGARLTDRTLIGRKGLPDTVNADLALSIVTVDGPSPTAVQQKLYPAVSLTVSGLDPKIVDPALAADPARKLTIPANKHQSVVLPMPNPGAPTTMSVVVVESNAGLATAKERVALVRKVRAKLIELTGGVIKEKLEAAAQ